LRSERILEDVESDDDDEDEKDLFDEFVIVDKDEADKIDAYLRKFNKPELLLEESKRKNEGTSMLLFSKKTGSDGPIPSSLEDFEIL
jgi:hypothetical protein